MKYYLIYGSVTILCLWLLYCGVYKLIRIHNESKDAARKAREAAASAQRLANRLEEVKIDNQFSHIGRDAVRRHLEPDLEDLKEM